MIKTPNPTPNPNPEASVTDQIALAARVRLQRLASSHKQLKDQLADVAVCSQVERAVGWVRQSLELHDLAALSAWTTGQEQRHDALTAMLFDPAGTPGFWAMVTCIWWFDPKKRGFVQQLKAWCRNNYEVGTQGQKLDAHAERAVLSEWPIGEDGDELSTGSPQEYDPDPANRFQQKQDGQEPEVCLGDLERVVDLLEDRLPELARSAARPTDSAAVAEGRLVAYLTIHAQLRRWLGEGAPVVPQKDFSHISEPQKRLHAELAHQRKHHTFLPGVWMLTEGLKFRSSPELRQSLAAVTGLKSHQYAKRFLSEYLTHFLSLADGYLREANQQVKPGFERPEEVV
jgi:hypothetical protein